MLDELLLTFSLSPAHTPSQIKIIVFLQKSSNPRKSYISRFSNRSPKETDKVINVLHPGRPNVSKTELKEKLSRLYDVNDTNAIFVFKFITHFGGGKSTGFCLIYDSVENAKKFEPKYRLIRNGLDTKIEKSRKQLKERKNRAKKICGVKKTKASDAAKAGKKK